MRKDNADALSNTLATIEKKYDDVMKAIRMASPSIHLKVIKSHCQSDVMMGEINIVLYALRYQGVLPPT